MRFIIATRGGPAGGADVEAFHAQLARAGVLLDADAHGRALIEVRSHDEAIEWTRRCPRPGEAELCPLGEDEDFDSQTPPKTQGGR